MLASATVPRVFGLVLLTAAILKAADLGMAGNDSFFVSIFLHLGLIGFETALGLWLLSGVSPDRARVVSLACFAAFLGVATVQALTGQASCACLGKTAVVIFPSAPIRNGPLTHARLSGTP